MNGSLTPRTATLERSVELAPDHRLIVVSDPLLAAAAPGQFVNLSVPGIGEFPVSTAGFNTPGEVVTCIRRAGRVTAALFNQPEGVELGIRGPFGNGFPLQDFAGRDALLIAGGLGMAPLRSLLKALLDGPQPARSLTLLYGARDPESLLFIDELRDLDREGRIRLRLSVDFAEAVPWREQPGLCRIGLVGSLLQDIHPLGRGTVAAVCGPPVLYTCLLEQLAAGGIPPGQIYATLERRMRCGVGSCCHCVTAEKFVCRDGPVFSLAQLRTMPGAVEGIP